jgi:putative phage-type endonuclease
MSYVEVLPADAPREEWLEARRAGVGSSDIAVLLGLSNWDSPFGLYHRKTGALGEQDELERMYWGRKLEAVIADEFAERHPEFQVWPCGLVRSVERPYQQATPDRLLIDAESYGVVLRDDVYSVEPCSALEVKTDESMDGWGPDGTDEIPVKYRAQVLWQADCLGLPGVHVAALLPGKRYREYYVERDEDDLKLMRDVAETFMDRVRRGDPPDVDGHPATIETLRVLHPDVDDEEARVPDTLAQAYRRACRNAEKAKDRKRLLEARLRQRMGRAKYAVGRDGERVATRSVYEVREHVRRASTVDKLVPAKEPA